MPKDNETTDPLPDTQPEGVFEYPAEVKLAKVTHAMEQLPKSDPTEQSLATTPFTWKTIHAISQTEFVPKGLRNRPQAILACVLAGREIGLPPMESMRSIDIIDGKVSPSAELMLNLIRKAGHRIKVFEWTDKKCVLIGVRKLEDGWDEPEESFPVEFNADMAKRAGLVGKNNWKHYPEAMLYWRALTMLARTFFPDVISALKYLPEELGSDTWYAEPPQVPEDYDVKGEPERPDEDDEDIEDAELVDGSERRELSELGYDGDN